ncbi:MAG: hypothetical protein IH845_04995 [Nanoarchaeota archaeon]|nr:hypothetical protein [Nanoarchaeota archaeon]
MAESENQINTLYAVLLPIVEFRSISPIENIEITVAATPESAVRQVIARGCYSSKKHRDQRNRTIGDAVNRLKREGSLDIENYAFEINDKIYRENGKRLHLFERDFEDSRLYFLAEELTKLHDPKPSGNLGIARKVLDFYDSQRRQRTN